VTSLEAARQAILQRVACLGSEAVPLHATAGRILSTDEIAGEDLPPWNNSAMDGFAVRAQDCSRGVQLAVVDFLPAGQAPTAPLRPGTAVRILTGAPLPDAADTVIPFEAVEESEGAITVVAVPEVGDHIRLRGGDVARGDVVLPAGSVVGPAEIAVLAAVGRTMLQVVRQPRVAILSTGDELLAPGEPPAPGRIHDSNGPALAAAVAGAGGVPVSLPIARDDPASLRDLISLGLGADALITSAGVSMGDRDLVRATLAELGVVEVFWQVEIQPGRPMAFGVAGPRCVFSLPGNPVAALLTFELLVRPALRKMTGHPRPADAPLRAVLADAIQPRRDRTTLMRVRLALADGRFVATSAGRQATGYVQTLARSDGVALIPPGTEALPLGTMVDVHPLRDIRDFAGDQG
jgi:molybdopterin molybdotransferase